MILSNDEKDYFRKERSIKGIQMTVIPKKNHCELTLGGSTSVVDAYGSVICGGSDWQWSGIMCVHWLMGSVCDM